MPVCFFETCWVGEKFRGRSYLVRVPSTKSVRACSSENNQQVESVDRYTLGSSAGQPIAVAYGPWPALTAHWGASAATVKAYST